MLHRATLFFILSILLLPRCFAGGTGAEHFELPLDDVTEISIARFSGSGDRILWIHSEYGINKDRHYSLMKSLAALNHEVWLAEVHDSYFIPAGRSSYTEIPLEDITRLIESSLPEGERKLFIVSTGRAAVLSTLALNRLQASANHSIVENKRFGGIVMIHPSFQADTPAPGTAMRFLPVVDSTQLPIYIIQPKKSNKYWYLDELVTRLNDGGSQVYTQIIDQVSDGYHVRPETSDIEKQKAKRLPSHISRAIRLLAHTEITIEKKRLADESWSVSGIPESLQPYPDNSSAPTLKLMDTENNSHDLLDYRGKVIVLNFWATWCPPCVKEIPSLGRLQLAFSEQDLVVLSVDIGEEKNEIDTFLQQVPADFPVLLNPDGSTVKQWKIVAFPTTFIIDREGIIRLAYYGGLEWDNKNVIAQLQALVDE